MKTIIDKQKMITGELSLQEMINGMTATKCFVLLASLMFLTTVSCAQLRPLLKGIDEVDLIAGPSLVSLYGSKWANDGKVIRILYSGGIAFRYLLDERSSISSKILFDRKGLKREFEFIFYENGLEMNGHVEVLNTFSYVTAPILYRHSWGNRVLFFAEGGGFVGYLTDQKTNINDLTLKIFQEYSESQYYKKLDMGLAISVGYKMPVNKEVFLSIQFFTQVGMIDINKTDINAKTYVTTLLVGISFN